MAGHENSVANRNDSRYCIASITKWMTLIVLLRMLENHEIEVNDPLDKYVTGIPNGRKITLLDLINHRSGMPHELLDEEAVSAPRSAEDMAEIAKTIKPIAQPGERSGHSSGRVLPRSLGSSKL